MQKRIGTYDALEETLAGLGNGGLLLVSGKQGNPMTIGWGTLGYIWSKPVFEILVRPARHTFGLIENITDFTVNVVPAEFDKQMEICGTESGRDVDKIAKCNFEMKRGECSNAFYIDQSIIHYECRIIHKNNVDPVTLEPSIIDTYYDQHDFHTVYYGEILGVFRT